MSDYQPTPKQEQAIREFLRAAVMPLIEDVVVKKLGQAMVFLKEQQQQEQRQREQPLGFNVVIKETKPGGEFRVVSIDPITSVEK